MSTLQCLGFSLSDKESQKIPLGSFASAYSAELIIGSRTVSWLQPARTSSSRAGLKALSTSSQCYSASITTVSWPTLLSAGRLLALEQ